MEKVKDEIGRRAVSDRYSKARIGVRVMVNLDDFHGVIIHAHIGSCLTSKYGASKC